MSGIAVSLGRPGDAVGFEGETDAEGCFELGGLVAPGERDYFLTVATVGYKPLEETFRSVGEYAVLVRLAPEGSGEDSAVMQLADEESHSQLERCSGQRVAQRPDELEPATPSPPPLPSFEDYPVTEFFTGEPAAVNLESHPDGRTFRTALTRGAEAGAEEARFAGHYRIVVIGCGTSCQTVWAVDLVDGSLRQLFTSSFGVAARPDSRLLIENDPAFYESLLEEMSATEVQQMMDRYGPPRFWVETDGEFERIPPYALRIDPETGKIVPGSPSSAARWHCANDLEVRCADGTCEAEAGDGFTPMSVDVDDSGAMSVCAYSGCWEGAGRVLESDGFLVVIGRDLEFSTARDPDARADIVISIDRADGVAILKAEEFAQPLLCESREG